jgi:hypothetical protein
MPCLASDSKWPSHFFCSPDVSAIVSSLMGKVRVPPSLFSSHTAQSHLAAFFVALFLPFPSLQMACSSSHRQGCNGSLRKLNNGQSMGRWKRLGCLSVLLSLMYREPFTSGLSVPSISSSVFLLMLFPLLEMFHLTDLTCASPPGLPQCPFLMSRQPHATCMTYSSPLTSHRFPLSHLLHFADPKLSSRWDKFIQWIWYS